MSPTKHTGKVMRLLLPMLFLVLVVPVWATSPPVVEDMRPEEIRRVPPLPVVPVPWNGMQNCTVAGEAQVSARNHGGIETCMDLGRGREWLVSQRCIEGDPVQVGQGWVCETRIPMEPQGRGAIARLGGGPPPWAMAWERVTQPFAGFWKWLTDWRGL